MSFLSYFYASLMRCHSNFSNSPLLSSQHSIIEAQEIFDWSFLNAAYTVLESHAAEMKQHVEHSEREIRKPESYETL